MIPVGDVIDTLILGEKARWAVTTAHFRPQSITSLSRGMTLQSNWRGLCARVR